ncbi:MAG: hypothetical protein V4792_08540 [Pseudomonadota bacterium]
MNTTRQDLIQRSSAFVLAAIVTLAMLGSIDAMATQDVRVDARLAQQAAAVAVQS